MTAMALLLERTFNPEQPGGVSRLAALGCFLVALAGAAFALLVPGLADWAGVALLVAVAAAAAVLLYAAWPKQPGASE